MIRNYYIPIIAVSMLLLAVPCAYPEQVDQDMYAQVYVNPIFTLSLDNANISFGYSDPGKTIELKPDTYYNLVKCRSNKGKTWYLKVSIMGEIAGPQPPISLDSFKWKVFRSTGDGVPQTGWQPFTKEPVLVYTSGPGDNTGAEVIVQFQYKLDMPASATGGYYSVKVLYSMTDIP